MIDQVKAKDRLAFLKRVTLKEIEHLDFAALTVFKKPFTIEIVRSLDENKAFAMDVEAFISRFCRLQDTLGDKLLPALLKSLGEPEKALLINLDKAEKYGWLASSDQWIALRQLRNLMIHEYIEDPEVFLDALTTAYNNIGVLKQFAKSLLNQVDELIN